MGALWSSLFGPAKPIKEKHPIKGGPAGRIKNALTNHFRGILGFIILVITGIFTGSVEDRGQTVYCMWITMFLFFLIHPISIPVTGMMPVYYLVLFGVFDSNKVCKCYYGPGTALFMLAGMVAMLLNNSKFDRRVMFWIMDPDQPVTPTGFLIKASGSAFILSVFSDKLLVAEYMIEMLTPAFNNEGAELKKYRNIIMNAIQTSASIGGIAILHGSLTTLAMKILYEEVHGVGKAGANTFNYFTYLPVFVLSIVMFVFNLVYHIILIKVQISSDSVGSNSIQDALSSGKAELPREMTCHEIQTVIALILALIVFVTRKTHFGGWQDLFSRIYPPDDMVTAAFFVIILSVLPKGCSFIKVLKASKKSEMPPCKPESAIMFWKFVDKNTIYGYLFLIGGGNALTLAVTSIIGKRVADSIGKIITFGGITVSHLMVVVLTVILVNIMSGVAAVCVMLPLVLSTYGYTTAWYEGSEIMRWSAIRRGSLAVGLAGSLGFACPFKYTCAYYVHHVCKVPKMTMAILGIGSAIVCMPPLLVFIMTGSWAF